jgi:hypothetical protein
MSAVFAYGYCRASSDLAHLGAGKRTYIDHDSKRLDRGRLLSDLRAGDVLRVLYLKDLSGAGAHNETWCRRIEAMGVTVEEHRPATPPKPIGRPRAIPDDKATRGRLRTVWLDGTRTLADRLQAVSDILGGPVSRQSLYRAFGKPDDTKEQPSD